MKREKMRRMTMKRENHLDGRRLLEREEKREKKSETTKGAKDAKGEGEGF